MPTTYRRSPGYGALPPLARYQWIYEEELRVQELAGYNRSRYHSHALDSVDSANSTKGIYEPNHMEPVNCQLNWALAREQSKQIEIVDLTAEDAPQSSLETSHAGVDILALACAEIGDFEGNEESTSHQQADVAPTVDMVSQYFEEIEYGIIESSYSSGKTATVEAEIDDEE